MIFRICSRVHAVLVVALLGCLFSFSSHARPIRLRTPVFPHKPSPPSEAAPGAQSTARTAASTSSPALYLVQFRGPLKPAWRLQLKTAGVDLLRFIADDTFAARIESADPNRIAAFEFVEWIGPFDPRSKLHRSLQSFPGRTLSGQKDVTILLAPRSPAAAVAGVRNSLSRFRQENASRFGTVLRGRVNAAQFDSLAASGAVLWIEPAPDMKLFDEVSSSIVAGEGGDHQLYTQSLGYDGSGVTVAVADSGLNNGDAETMHPDLFGRADVFFQYGTLTDAADEHSHGTHVAGIIAGDGATGGMDEYGFLYGLGVAPAARIVTQRLFDGVGNYEAPPSYETLTRHATRAGAEIGSNSWGDDTQGRYDTSAMEFDALVRDADALAAGDQPYILEFSAGNAGPGAQTIGSPAVAKNVIATGASQNDRADYFIYTDGIEAMADFSSRGPCEDGRIKPDITAPGTWIASLKSESATEDNAWLPIDYYYLYMGGTSQAGPHASGAAAVFVQYYRETVTNQTPSPALVKAALINSAVDLDDTSGTTAVPNMDEGWGRIDLTELIGSSRRYEFVEQTNLLATGQAYEQHVSVASGDESLKITLVYTDVPGFPGAIPALVNDLDLEVVAPDGTLYRGNQFSAGESIPNAAAADRINNVEGIHLALPQAGQYTVRVRAHNVVEDARVETVNVDQDFALVISADLALPGAGVVALDRTAYRAPGQMRIQVVDSDQAGSGSVSVTLNSSTEPAGETFMLAAAGGHGAFTGMVATATGPAAMDGALQIADGDVIQALYYDASAGVERMAMAIGDFVAPLLTQVSVTNRFGQATIQWQTDEPASSIVRYSTNATFAGSTSSVTNPVTTTSHGISLSGLAGGQTYYFYVESADVAGNRGTNNNSGAYYSFVVAPVAAILLVDEYDDPLFGAPPLSGYTDALDQLGAEYDFWDYSILGEPDFNDLHPYRVVIWRVPELTGAWSANERIAISNYLNSGGAMFVGSMEIFSRLSEVGGSSFITDVLQVASYATDETGSTLAGEVIGTGTVGRSLDIFTDYTVYETLWFGFLGPDISDTFVPTSRASPVFYNDYGDIIGLRWPGIGKSAPGRLVLLSFPFDAIPLGSGVNDRANVLRNVLSFLAPGASGTADVALDATAYGLPGTVTVEVGDGDRAGQGSLTVSAVTTTEQAGMSLLLLESSTPGVFTGLFEIVSSTNSPVAGKLRAANGDLLTVSYLDASSGQTVPAEAMVDTDPPLISEVDAYPDYVQAAVAWTTSERADSLVQYGESAILNRSAFDSATSTNHEITLIELLPSRTYYYRVVSRDEAGNERVDDNNGQLYSFQTRTPIAPPWLDSMELGQGEWSVFSGEDSQAIWSLGVPNNGSENSSHSPQNAWGSNLDGNVVDYSESFLIGPAIGLTGGNVATLHFWHSYDFTETSEFDIIEFGQLLLFTNNLSAPVTLAQYSDVSGGWIEETIDLSPYVGNVVNLVWNYELFSFDVRVRPGWLLDDVSVTMSYVSPGTVRITNNLWQAPYVLTGPVYRSSKGTGQVITNAPPGTYSVTYGDVPYYTTPAAQTNTLVSGATAVFQGHYTFADSNTNGISDAWEQVFFGGVDPGRSGLGDFDQDGQNDYAEFVAGTDPKLATSKLKVNSIGPAPGGNLRLTWSSVAGRAYRVYGSTDLVNWAPVSDWIQATLSSTSFNLPTPVPGQPNLFRVEVRP